MVATKFLAILLLVFVSVCSYPSQSPWTQAEILSERTHSIREQYMEGLQDFSNFWADVHSVLSPNTLKPIIPKIPALSDPISPPSIPTFKREKRATEPGCFAGGRVISVGNTQTCVGKRCFLAEVLCGTETFTDSSINRTDCRVTKLTCTEGFSREKTNYSFPPEAKCYVSHMLCNGVYRENNEIAPGEVSLCSPQVVCGDNLYGHQSWGFPCYTQNLSCSGQNCEIKNLPCEHGNLNSVKCDHVTCTTNSGLSFLETLLEAVCTTGRINQKNCIAGKIVCSGSVYDTKDDNKPFSTLSHPPLYQCEHIRTIKCEGPTEITLPYRYCRPFQLNCNGNSVAFLNQAIVSEGCFIESLVCTNTSQIVLPIGPGSLEGCFFNRIGSSKCSANSLVIKSNTTCAERCTKEVVSTQCVCPIDKTGTLCQDSRPISCRATLESPQSNCGSDRYPGDPVCYNISFAETTLLKFSVSCKFTDRLQKNSSEAFPYGFKNDKFAISEKIWVGGKSLWRINFSVLNFVEFSNPIVKSYEITEDILEGTVAIEFPLNPEQLQQVSKNYLLGNRIHLDASLDLGSTPIRTPGIRQTIERIVLDIPGLEGPKKTTWLETYRGSLIVAVFCLAVVFVCGLIFLYLSRRNQRVTPSSKLHDE